MAGIWPRLRKKFSGDGKRKKNSKSKKSANPYASSGLEKFATLLEGLQSQKTSSLVERTASSLSAARSISRSAQEWTATTLARSASRRSEHKPSQCAAFEALAPKPALAIVGDLQRDSEHLSEERQPEGSQSHVTSEEVSSSVLLGVHLPVKTSRCRSMKMIRSLHRQGWRQTSKSAFVVLVAMGAFISSRFGEVGKPLAAVLTFSAVIRIWRKGKVSARFMFSSVALYFFTPLRSYLVTRIPTRLRLLPRNLKVISDTNATEEKPRNPEVELAQERRDSRLAFPVTPLESASSQAVVKESAPLSILLPIPESSASALAIESLPVTVFRKSSGASGPPRRLAKKISSKFKKLKMFRSSSTCSASTSLSSLGISESSHHSGTLFSATSEPSSSSSPSSHSSRPSSPDRRRMCPFSRRLHRTTSSDITEAQNDDSTSQSGSRKCIIMRRQKSSEGMPCKKSKLGRMLSSETLEQYDISESMSSSASSSLHGKLPSASSTNLEDASGATSRDDISWPVVGLLVTLLFLLVGRFPAIMATSLFVVVVSNAHHDRAHPRGRGRDDRALEAARKLRRSPPPRGQRWAAGSPPRRF